MAAARCSEKRLRAQEILAEQFDVSADVWSATSYKLLRNDALASQTLEHASSHRAARKNPTWKPRLQDEEGVFVAVSDYMKMVPDQIAPWVPGGLTTLGTDGFGRSDTRQNLAALLRSRCRMHRGRNALCALATEGKLAGATVEAAIKKLGIDPEKPFPFYL